MLNPITQQQLNSLLNTEVTPQQLKKIDKTLYYVIKPTRRAKNNRVTHGILLAYNTEELYLVDPKEVLKRLTGRDCVSYILNYGEE